MAFDLLILCVNLVKSNILANMRSEEVVFDSDVHGSSAEFERVRSDLDRPVVVLVNVALNRALSVESEV